MCFKIHLRSTFSKYVLVAAFAMFLGTFPKGIHSIGHIIAWLNFLAAGYVAVILRRYLAEICKSSENRLPVIPRTFLYPTNQEFLETCLFFLWPGFMLLPPFLWMARNGATADAEKIRTELFEAGTDAANLAEMPRPFFESSCGEVVPRPRTPDFEVFTQ